MARRGPKLKTAGNTADRRVGAIRRGSLQSPSSLGDEAQAEFQRLVGVLRSKGSLERVDLAVLAEASRIKALLDKAHAAVDVADAHSVKVVNLLTTQRRGLLRELGLTLQPSRSVLKTAPTKAESDPIAAKIKLA